MELWNVSVPILLSIAHKLSTEKEAKLDVS
jgi:hypothetical protein